MLTKQGTKNAGDQGDQVSDSTIAQQKSTVPAVKLEGSVENLQMESNSLSLIDE